MTPETGRSDPIVWHGKRGRATASSPSMPADTPSSLVALSAASDQYTRMRPPPRPSRTGPNILIAVTAGLIVGAALTLAGRFEYLCAATMQVTGEDAHAEASALHKELLAYAWRLDSASPTEGRDEGYWFVDVPRQDRLRLCLTTPEREPGLESVQRHAEAFVSQMMSKAAQAKQTPGEGERVLSQIASELQTRLDDAQARLESALEASAATEPLSRRDTLLQQWRDQRDRFSKARDHLADATERYESLKAQPEPLRGNVAKEERQKALEADLALQQDLKELEVNLAELKLQLLNVWQASAAPLTRSVDGAAELARTIREIDTAPLADDLRKRLSAMADYAREHYEAAESFRVAWNREFVTLKQMDADPYTGEMIDVQHRVRTLLGDYLFKSGKRFAALREQLQAIADEPSDQARYHVLVSDLTRAFQTAESTYHRFEFSAEAVKVRNNFRLDTAWKSARGLRRRSQQRIRKIDEKLEKMAIERARKARAAAIASALADTTRLRSEADKAAAKLVALQEQLNVQTGVTEDFLRQSLTTKAVKRRLSVTQQDLEKTEASLRRLAAAREAAAARNRLELIDCQVVDGPINLASRLRLGGIGALVTLLTVGLGQWWMGRRAS